MDVAVGALAVGGALMLLVSAVAELRAPDALSRINVLGPATGLGLPMVVTAGYLAAWQEHGFSWVATLKLLATVVALLVVSSVGSNVLARATYLSGAPLDPATDPHDLRDDPGDPRV